MQRRGRPPGKGRGRAADIEKALQERHNELQRGYRAQRTPEQRAAQNAQDRERQAANRADPVIGPHLRQQAARRARKPGNIERRSQQREALTEEARERVRARDREWHQNQAGIKTKAEYTAADKQGRSNRCSCCGRLFVISSLVSCTAEQLRDQYQIDGSLIDRLRRACPPEHRPASNMFQLCSVCKKNLLANVFPDFCYDTCPLPEIPAAIARLNATSVRLIAPELPFTQITPLTGTPQTGVSSAIYVPAVTSNTVRRLPREDNDAEVIQMPGSIITSDASQHQQQVRYEQIDRTAVAAALSVLRNRPVYEGIEINEQYAQGRRIESFVVAPRAAPLPPPPPPPPLAATNQPQQQLHQHQHYNPVSGETLVWNQNDTDQALCEFREYADKELDRLEPHSMPFENPLVNQFNEAAEFRRFINAYLGSELQVFAASGERDQDGNRVFNNSVSYYRRSKWELEHGDTRFQSAEHIFFKYVALMQKRMEGALDVYLRQIPARQAGNNNNQPLTAADVRTSRQLGKLLRANKCYELLRGIHNSPTYWAGRKREVHAMIRQLGPPTLFLTLSQAQTEWPQLLITLAKVLDNRVLSEEEAKALPRQEKLDLLRRHPVTVAHYFNRKVELLFNFMQHCADEESPFGRGASLVDHYIRVEFGSETGAPHVHCLLWLNGDSVPKPASENNQQISNFVDQCISCSRGSTEAERVLVAKHQVHHHSGSCQKAGECRFGYPLPPMPCTVLLTPLSDAERNAPQVREQALLIRNELIRRSTDENQDGLTFAEMLREPAFGGCTEQQYIDAVRYWLKSPKLFLRRAPDEVWINAYNPVLLDLHRANMDLQFVLDPYAVASYIFKTTNKAFSHGMTPLLQQLARTARSGASALQLRPYINEISKRFLYSRQLGVQEPLYTLLGLPVSKCSRSVEFINTNPPETRDRKLKPRAELNALPPESEEIFARSNLIYYTLRNDDLKDLSAEEVVANYRVHLGRPAGNAEERMEEGGGSGPSDEEMETSSGDTVHLNDPDVNEFNIENMQPPLDDDDPNIDPDYDSDDDLEGIMAEDSDDEGEFSSSDDDDEGEEGEGQERAANRLPTGKRFPIPDIPGAEHVKRKKKAIIRFVNYSKLRDPFNYMREQLMLYIPWRDEEENILRYCDTMENLTTLYNYRLEEITARKLELFPSSNFEKTFEHKVVNRRAQWTGLVGQKIQLGDAFAILYPRNDPRQPLQQGNAGRDRAEEGERVRGEGEDEEDGEDGEDDDEDEDENAELRPDFQRPPLLPVDEYVRQLARLNDQQRQIVLEVLRLYSSNKQFYIFVYGGAGTGKSFFIKMVRFVIADYARRRAELAGGPAVAAPPDPVLLLAPTGRAAYNIGGSTLHSALRLAVSAVSAVATASATAGQRQQLKVTTTAATTTTTLLPPSAAVLANLRAEHRGVNLALVDESSMVNSSLLGQVSTRFNQIAGLGDDALFGGKSVILVGDFGQLRPVNGAWIFQPVDSSNSINNSSSNTGRDDTESMAVLAGTYIWQQFNSFQLLQSERHQGDRAFARALNELRLGSNQLSPQSKRLFANCQWLTTEERVRMPSLPPDTLHLFRSNREVDRFNSEAIEKARASNVYAESHAVDRCQGVNYLSVDRLNEELEQVVNRHYTANCGLSRSLELCTNLRYMLTSNLATNDGLVNGAIGRLMRFERMPLPTEEEQQQQQQRRSQQQNQVQELGRVYLLWLLFDRAEVGQRARSQYSEYIGNQQGEIDNTWTPVELSCFKIGEVCRGRTKLDVFRQQFPVVPAEAVTVYKSQGGTYTNVAFHVPEFDCTLEELYVACSRATTAAGLYILDRPFPLNISLPENDPVSIEYARLEENKLQVGLHTWEQTDDRFRVTAHHIGNFNLFATSTFADQAFRDAHLLLLTGTGQLNDDGDRIDFGNGFVELPDSRIDPGGGLGGSVVVVKRELAHQIETVRVHHDQQGRGRLELTMLKLETNVYVISVFKSALYPTAAFVTALRQLLESLEYLTAVNCLLVVGSIALAPEENTQELLELFQRFRLTSLLPRCTDEVEEGAAGQKQLDFAFGRTGADISAHLYISPTSLHPPIMAYL